MEYQRLPYPEYFINTSDGWHQTGKATYPVKYLAEKYNTTSLGKLLGLAHEANYEIHYEPDRDVIQLHFQWTVGTIDWVANVLEFSSKYYDAIDYEGEKLQLRVHHGWGDMYKAIKHLVRDGWKQLHDEHPEAYTEVIGWSLGSAIAQLCAQDLNYNFGTKAYLYTFGSVKPFKYVLRNKKRTLNYLSQICSECRNFSDINDIITYMPPFRGFTEVNRVDVGLERRKLKRLLNPLKYHTHYYLPELYED